MMSAITLMNLAEYLYPFSLRDAALEYFRCAPLIEHSAYDGIALGSADQLPSLYLVIRDNAA